MLFVAGARPLYLVLSGIVGAIGGWFFIQQDPVRMKRITAFLDPWADPSRSRLEYHSIALCHRLWGHFWSWIDPKPAKICLSARAIYRLYFLGAR